MSIYIDCREGLIKENCESLALNNPLFTGINIISKKLDVADIVIKNSDESECIYIERKDNCRFIIQH